MEPVRPINNQLEQKSAGSAGSVLRSGSTAVRVRQAVKHLLNDHSFQFHRRCAVWIMLVVSAAVLVGIAWFKFQEFDRLAEDQRGIAAETRRLSARLAAFELRDAADADRMEEKLRELGNKQDEFNALSSNRSTKAPFAIESVLPSVVEVVCIDNDDRDSYYTGSGTVIDEAGLVLTNHHLLLSEDRSLIRMCGIGFTSDSRTPPRIRYAAVVEVIREDSDLALLRITEDLERRPMPDKFAALDLSGVREAALALGIGDPIFIAGYPGIGAETFTFTQGVVSGRVGAELIKTSALIDSGTSGGAAFDANGKFVGVPTAAAQGDIGGSLGYLIAGETVDDFLTAYYGRGVKTKSR
jgi:S1-C subfamily serine protease